MKVDNNFIMLTDQELMESNGGWIRPPAVEIAAKVVSYAAGTAAKLIVWLAK